MGRVINTLFYIIAVIMSWVLIALCIGVISVFIALFIYILLGVI